MRIKHILLPLFAAFMAVSCDSFLDVEPVGKAIPKTYSEYRALITDAYNSQLVDRSYSAFLSDEAQFVPSDDSYIPFYKDIYIWNVVSPDASTIETPWQKFYKVIFYANHIIKNKADITEGTTDEVNQLVGEAYLLRAYMYFNLVNLYADHYNPATAATMRGVPISDLDNDLEKRNKPSSVEAVYSKVLADIESGTALLNVSEQPKGYNYRFSKVSAYGFAARAYLYMGSYAKAQEFAQKALAINSKLEDLNSASAVMPYSYKSVENIFALEQTYTLDNSSTLAVSASLVAAYDKANDLRFNALYRSSGSRYKVKMNGRNDNKVSLRTAELYLIKAEAIAQGGGNLDDAKSTLKELLKSRLKPSYYSQRALAIDAMDKDGFVQEVFAERNRELAFQGFRWFDLKRNGKPSITKTYDGETFVLQQNDPRYIVRFPKEAVVNNPYLAD